MEPVKQTQQEPGVSDLPEVIVSLTSYPARISTVHQAIKTLLGQTVMPGKIILWLADSQFPEKEQSLPKQLMELCSEVFQIR